jgi:hypothetical protein
MLCGGDSHEENQHHEYCDLEEDEHILEANNQPVNRLASMQDYLQVANHF